MKSRAGERWTVRIFRYSALILIINQVIYLLFYPGEKEWLYILIVWIAFLGTLLIYQYVIFWRAHRNLSRLVQEMEGILRKGRFWWGIPSGAKFEFLGRNCQVEYVIDAKFDPLVELSCSIEKEIELGICHKKEKPVQKDEFLEESFVSNKASFLKEFVISGEDQKLADTLFESPSMMQLIVKMLQDFRQFHIGKDSLVRLTGDYHSYLTRPEKVFSTLSDVDRVIKFLEEKSGA